MRLDHLEKDVGLLKKDQPLIFETLKAHTEKLADTPTRKEMFDRLDQLARSLEQITSLLVSRNDR